MLAEVVDLGFCRSPRPRELVMESKVRGAMLAAEEDGVKMEDVKDVVFSGGLTESMRSCTHLAVDVEDDELVTGGVCVYVVDGDLMLANNESREEEAEE